MTNTQHLNSLLADIAKITGQSISEEQAKENGHERWLHIEHNSNYGGYRLVSVSVGSGGHSGAFGGNGCESRLKYKVMVIKLEGILAGLSCPQSLINKTKIV